MAKKNKKIKGNRNNEAYQKMLHWFFAFPYKQVSLNELSKNLEISKVNANRIVARLIGDGFLNKKVIGKTWQLLCNTKHQFNQSEKIPYNLKLIYNSGVLNLINNKFPNAKAIILFGSYRWGSDDENSDIDIAVEILGKEKLKIEKLTRLKVIGFRKNVPVNIHLFSKKNIDINLYTNIINGILLEGLIEVNI